MKNIFEVLRAKEMDLARLRTAICWVILQHLDP